MTQRYAPDKHHRRSIRLRSWDYTSPGAYFITICTHERECLFDDGRFHAIAENAWRNIPNHDHAQHVVLDEWVVMPNHLHGIIILTDATCRGEAGRCDGPGTLETPIRPLRSPLQKNPSEPGIPQGVQPGSVGAIVGNFKSLVAKQINNLRLTAGGRVWQRGYYDRIARNERELEAIRDYIRKNPDRWADDRENLDALLSKMRLVVRRAVEP